MNDNQTTELLCKLLEEYNVEYETYRDVKNRFITKWRTYNGAFVFFAVEKEGKLFVETSSDTEHSAICTPEQAIAATLGSGKAKDLLLRTFGLAQMMYDCWLEECKAGDNVDVSACNAYSYEFDQIAQAMFDMGIDPNDSDYYRSAELGSGTCEFVDDSDRESSPPKCNSCGYDPGIYECAWLDDGTYEYERNYCPNCGKAVKR